MHAPEPIAAPTPPARTTVPAPAAPTTAGADLEAPATAPHRPSTHPSRPSRPSRRALLRLGALFAVLAAAMASLLLWDPSAVLAAASGPWRIPIALAAYGFGSMAFLPRPAMNAGMGLLFGSLWGVPLAVAGSAIGAAAAFVLGRSLGREALRPLVRGRVLTEIDRRLSEQGFRSVLLIRLFPGAPFQAGNFACAFSGVKFWPYLLATVIGVVPTTTAYVVAGASASSPTSPAFLISAGVIATMCAFSAFSLWRARPRRSA
ncbi:TVP38/TMEM64 family protein [Kitasatospora cineracea]|uniref:TVP38/TMEM64 family protein n=1 Tax=Kitasatospora cineracea TaxID=88074 RepID=UPI0036742AE0